MKDFYDGSGYHTNLFEKPSALNLPTGMQDLDEFLNTTTQHSEDICTSPEMERVLARWTRFQHILVKSWDLTRNVAEDQVVGGTLARFLGRPDEPRSADFKFTLVTRNPNLAPNMHRLREEVDCDVSLLDSYLVGGIRRWAGATPTRDFQIITTQIGDQHRWGWIAIGDQLFMPIINTWRYQDSATPSRDLRHKLAQPMTIQQAIQYQRGKQ